MLSLWQHQRQGCRSTLHIFQLLLDLSETFPDRRQFRAVIHLVPYLLP